MRLFSPGAQIPLGPCAREVRERPDDGLPARRGGYLRARSQAERESGAVAMDAYMVWRGSASRSLRAGPGRDGDGRARSDGGPPSAGTQRRRRGVRESPTGAVLPPPRPAHRCDGRMPPTRKSDAERCCRAWPPGRPNPRPAALACSSDGPEPAWRCPASCCVPVHSPASGCRMLAGRRRGRGMNRGVASAYATQARPKTASTSRSSASASR